MHLYFCAFGRHLDTQNIELKNMTELTQLEKEMEAILRQIRFRKVILTSYLLFSFSFFSSNIRVKWLKTVISDNH
jgi:hypothetical protein